MAKGGKREGAGRKPKPKIEISATKGVASSVLASIDEVETWRFLLHAEELADPEKREELTLAERKEIGDRLEYLTNRRDGKPAQGVFVGDTREGQPALERGDLPTHFETGAADTRGTNKPN